MATWSNSLPFTHTDGLGACPHAAWSLAGQSCTRLLALSSSSLPSPLSWPPAMRTGRFLRPSPASQGRLLHSRHVHARNPGVILAPPVHSLAPNIQSSSKSCQVCHLERLSRTPFVLHLHLLHPHSSLPTQLTPPPQSSDVSSSKSTSDNTRPQCPHLVPAGPVPTSVHTAPPCTARAPQCLPTVLQLAQHPPDLGSWNPLCGLPPPIISIHHSTLVFNISHSEKPLLRSPTSHSSFQRLTHLTMFVVLC